MSTQTGRLVLTPADPLLAPEPARLCAALGAIGLLGEPLPGEARAFCTGDAFLALLTFAGCSVQLETEAGPGGAPPPVHLRIDGPSASPRIWYGRDSPPPRCPACRGLLDDWRSLLCRGEAGACPRCHAPRSALHWEWRGRGGAGRLFVCIQGVFPGEAMPTPGLFRHLEQETGAAWRHFSLRDT